MKRIVAGLITTVFIAFGAQAQSKKKTNAALKGQLEQIRVQYDSIGFLCQRRYTDLKFQRNELTYELFDHFEIIHGRCERELSSTERIMRTLVELGEKPVDSIAVCRVYLHREKSEVNFLKHTYKDVLLKAPSISYVPYTLNLEGKKLEVQNALLTKQLEDFRKVNEQNSTTYALMGKWQDTLNLIKPKIDAINIRVSEYSERLVPYMETMQNKYRELKDKYRRGNPNDFSEAYHKEFGTINVIKDREVKDEVASGGFFAPPGDDEPEALAEDILGNPETQAEFVGGLQALKQYLSNNLRYPQTAIDRGVSGKCHLKFVVSTTGNISNVTVVKGVPNCPECDSEAMRVVMGMPNWIPARLNGEPVNSWFNLPISFKMTEQ